MYKRPPLRPREAPRKIHGPMGSFLHTILNTSRVEPYKRVVQPVYRKDDYLALLEKNNKEMGIPYVKPEIPDYEPPVRPQKTPEPPVPYSDRVYLKLRILKSGIIRVKLDASFATLHEKYYSQCKQPSVKAIVQAYKSMGFSDEFLTGIKKKFEKKAEYQKTVAKIIESVFEKEPVKKPKKKKEELQEEEEEEEEEEEDDNPEEDEGMDVEVEEDPDEQPQEEEEYFSDGGD